jgi:hypothetical protein
MITIYRVFQIILGIILSTFILYILIYYAGSYALVGEQTIRLKTLDVFLQDVDNVYFSGNSINFTKFSRDDFTSCHPRATNPPRLYCYIDGESYETEQLLTPVFTRLGEDVLITRNSLDLGWTKLDFIEALTGMRIIFNPLQSDDDTWNLMKDVVMSFPETTGLSPKLTFGFCDGNEIIEETQGDLWERDYFFRILTQPRDGLTFSPCSASLSHNQVLFTLSNSCSPTFANSGLCISPPQDGVGYAYIAGSSKDYVYKDPVDLAALIIGGERKNEFGDHVGEEIWEYKNQIFLDRTYLSAKVMERRNDFVTQHLPEEQQECSTTYLELKISLASIMDLANKDPYKFDDMTSLKAELDHAKDLWLDLLNMGCESYGSG